MHMKKIKESDDPTIKEIQNLQKAYRRDVKKDLWYEYLEQLSQEIDRIKNKYSWLEEEVAMSMASEKIEPPAKCFGRW